MNILPNIKKNLLCFLGQGKIILLCCLIFPMVMAYMYGTMQNNVFEGKSSFKAVKVQFHYDKTSEKGKVLSSLLKEEKVKSFLEQVDGNAQCSVDINTAFTEFNIKKLTGTDDNVELVRNFIKTFSEDISQYEMVFSNVNKLSINSSEKQDITAKLINKIQTSNSENIKEQLIEGYKTIGAREYYTISMFSMTSIMLILAIVKTFYKDKKNGILKRVFSTPNKRANYFWGFTAYVFIVCLIINVAYIFINKTFGIAFKDNIIAALLIALVQSLIQSSVAGAIVALIKDEGMVNTIMICILIVSGIFGGVFYSSDFADNSVIKTIANLTPNSLILNSYKGLYITEGIRGASNEILVGIILVLILFLVSIVKINKKWEC